MKRALLVAVTAALGAAGCTTGPVNTANPTTGDLIFRYGDLQAYLQERRQTLAGLEQRLSSIDTELLLKIGELQKAAKELQGRQATESGSAAELAALQSEVAALQDTAKQSHEQLLAAQVGQTTLASVTPSNAGGLPADKAEIEALKADVSKLEGEVGALQRGIDRTKETKQKLLLRSESGIRK